MPSLTDERFAALQVLVPAAPPTTNDMLFAWLATEGGTGNTLSDRWNTMLLSKASITSQGHRNDMWFTVLTANGFPQLTLNDKEMAYWLAGGPALV